MQSAQHCFNTTREQGEVRCHAGALARLACRAVGILLVGLTVVASLSAAAQGAAAQTCPEGHYRGPQPGKVRYTKDDYLWVVTPRFAQRFCMPEKFVDQDLKGAEAVAFKIGTDGEVNCGFGGNAEHCMAPRSLRFEIFLDSDLKLPVLNEVLYSNHYDTNAGTLIGRPHVAPGDPSRRLPIGRLSHFDPSAFGLLGIKGDRVVWPIVTLYEKFFYANRLPGLDLVVLEGSTGHFNNPRARAEGTRDFVIDVRKPNDVRKPEDKRVPKDFAHIIYLPRWFSDAIDRADTTQGTNWGEEVQQMQRERDQTEGAKR
jgi:hypothetical protein